MQNLSGFFFVKLASHKKNPLLTLRYLKVTKIQILFLVKLPVWSTDNEETDFFWLHVSLRKNNQETETHEKMSDLWLPSQLACQENPKALIFWSALRYVI